MEDTAIKVPTTITATKVNPILKRDPHHQSDEAGTKQDEAAATSADGAKPSPGREKKHLTWDEHAIEEHDQLRGTRMKIDEPNTPYTHYDHHSDDEASNSSGHHPRSPDENHPSQPPALATQWDSISSKLQAVADKRDAAPLSPAPSRDSNMSDTELSEDEVKKRKEQHEKQFKDMRKKHYNEVEAMKRWRAAHKNDVEDDEDDDEDNMEE